jgi:hypothetical protein
VPGLNRIISKVVAVQLDKVEGVVNTLSSARWWWTSSNERMPLSSQATASPSIMQKRERRRASAARIRYTSQVPGRRFQAADGGDLPSLIAIGAARGNSVHRLIIQRGHSPDEIRRLAARAASARRRSANGNSLCGQNSAGFLQTCKTFKGIICDDISEFLSYLPSHAVRSP